MDVRIKRHVKIRGLANPYDPAWEEYFERRQHKLAEQNLEGGKDVLFVEKAERSVSGLPTKNRWKDQMA